MKSSSHLCPSVCICGSLLSVLLLPGCGHPSAANNTLRVENQKLQDQVTQLKRDREADAATIKSLEQKVGTVPTLPADRLDHLFTTHGITLGKLTGQDDETGNLRVQLTPTDQDGQKLKAAGSITVDAFDLAASPDTHIGHWQFTPDEAKSNWFGSGLLYAYVLKLPWQSPPAHPDVTLKVTFTDSLTNRQFTEQKVVKVKPPATTTRPAPPT